jgi:hypothetical protein
MSLNAADEACLDFGPLDEILASMGDVGEGGLVPILQRVQDAYGYLPKPILAAVSERTGIAASRISCLYDPPSAGSGKAIIATARKFIGIIYNTLKNDGVFEDFPNVVLVSS